MKLINQLVLFLIFASLSSSILAFDERTIYLLRHAEKESTSGKDPGLTKLGKQRARLLASDLKSANITKIYSTQYKRTIQTVTPLSKAIDVSITHYNPKKLKEFSAQIKKETGNIVIVGHSNTTPLLTFLLGGEASGAIDESEYDRLYQLQFNAKGEVLTKLLRTKPLQKRLKVGGLEIDPQRFFNGQLTFRMSLKDKPVGESIHHFSHTAEAFILQEKTRLKDFNIDANIELEVDKQTLFPKSMKMSGTMGEPVDIQLSWNKNQVTGHSLMPRARFKPQGKIQVNHSHAKGTIERSTAIMLVHLYVLENNQNTAINWYDAYDDQLKHIDISYQGEEKVTVPAGTFETYKVRLQGGAPSQLFYISKELPARVVKIDVISSPWRYELISAKLK